MDGLGLFQRFLADWTGPDMGGKSLLFIRTQSVIDIQRDPLAYF
jgi:hypothetical protein